MATAALRPTPDQLALARRVAAPQEREGGGIVRLDSARYLDPGRFERERAALFGRLPLVIAPSALLPERNTAVPRDGFDTPLLITRDGGGRAHVFHNVCSVTGAHGWRRARRCAPRRAWSVPITAGPTGPTARSPPCPAPTAFPASTRVRWA